MKYTKKESENKNPVKLVLTSLDGVVGDLSLKVGFIQTATSCRGSDYKQIHKKITTALKKADYDIVIAPEYSFVPEYKVFDEDIKNEILESVICASKGSRTLVLPGTFLWAKDEGLHNTAYAVFDGNKVCEYDKINEGGEESIAKDLGLTFVNGDSPGFFTWNSLNVGLEICADAGILNKSKIVCDLHVLMSCGMRGTVNCGKYTLVNDGDDGTIKVFKGKQMCFVSVLW